MLCDYGYIEHMDNFPRYFFFFKIEKYFPLKYIRFKNITKIKRKHIFPEKNFIENKDSNNKWNGNLSFLFRKKTIAIIIIIWMSTLMVMRNARIAEKISILL